MLNIKCMVYSCEGIKPELSSLNRGECFKSLLSYFYGGGRRIALFLRWVTQRERERERERERKREREREKERERQRERERDI